MSLNPLRSRSSSNHHAPRGSAPLTPGYLQLALRIRNHTAKVAVVGQGYVGFPLAQAIAAAGFPTTGYDISEVTIADIRRRNRSRRYKATSSPAELTDCDIALIAVPTPTRLDGSEHRPDLSLVVAATRNVLAHWPEHDSARLLVVESTYAPGTTRNVIAPLVNAWHHVGRNVFLGYSPERIDPGNGRFNVVNTPKVVSGYDALSSSLTELFYGKFVETVVCASSLEAAEAAKLLENTFRFINITFAQEFDEYCEQLGLNAKELTQLAGTKPFGFMPFVAGAGIGGHCIAEDPYYLLEAVQRLGVQADILHAALRNHEARSGVIARRVQDLLGCDLRHARLLLLGVTYKADVPDTRQSPALAVLRQLEAGGAAVDYHDPYVPRFADRESIDLATVGAGDYHLLVLVTPHKAFDIDALRERGCRIFDTRETPVRPSGRITEELPTRANGIPDWLAAESQPTLKKG